MPSHKALSFLLPVLTYAAPLWSQTGTSTIRGNVTDPQGLAVVGATVTLTNAATDGDAWAKRAVDRKTLGDHFGLRAGLCFLYFTFGCVLSVGFWTRPLISNATVSLKASAAEPSA